MREIKFRAWDGIRMIMPDSGAYYQHYLSFCGEITQRCSEGMACFGGEDIWRAVRDLRLMQYTGLKDANGVEIYEGDIVEYFSDFTEEKSNHQVKYFCNDDYPAFDFSPSISDDMNGFSALVYQEIGTVKVIGNIYQNSELLK